MKYTGIISASNKDYKEFLFFHKDLKNTIRILKPDDLRGRNWDQLHETKWAMRNNQHYQQILNYMGDLGLLEKFLPPFK